MMLRGVTDAADGCPVGQKLSVTLLPFGMKPLTSCVPAYEEGWMCRYFGAGCTGPPPGPAPAAPRTPAQMTQPGAWTPAQSSTETAEEYTRRINEYYRQNPGVAVAQAGANQAGDAVVGVVDEVGAVLAEQTVRSPYFWMMVAVGLGITYMVLSSASGVAREYVSVRSGR